MERKMKQKLFLLFFIVPLALMMLNSQCNEEETTTGSVSVADKKAVNSIVGADFVEAPFMQYGIDFLSWPFSLSCSGTTSTDSFTATQQSGSTATSATYTLGCTKSDEMGSIGSGYGYDTPAGTGTVKFETSDYITYTLTVSNVITTHSNFVNQYEDSPSTHYTIDSGTTTHNGTYTAVFASAINAGSVKMVSISGSATITGTIVVSSTSGNIGSSGTADNYTAKSLTINITETLNTTYSYTNYGSAGMVQVETETTSRTGTINGLSYSSGTLTCTETKTDTSNGAGGAADGDVDDSDDTVTTDCTDL